jgi:hypothetical protein
MKFVPSKPRSNGQLYGPLEDGCSLTNALFRVNGVPVNHIALKSLESKPSSGDFQKLDAHHQRCQGRGFMAGWLLDHTIDAYLSILTKQNLHCHTLACSEVFALCQPRPGITQSAKAAERLGADVQVLLMPFNPNNSHWSLLVLQLQENRMLHFDSLNQPVSAALAEAVKSNLWAWWGVDCRDASILAVPCHKQTDGSSCGVYLLHFAEQFLKGQPLDSFRASACDPAKFRLKVFRELVTHPDNSW